MKKTIIIPVIMIISVSPFYAQKNALSSTANQKNSYRFTTEIDLNATSVKDQARTNTCWCFSTASFFESELYRMGKGEYDLSEMFIVRENYINRLKDNYLKQGKGSLGEGGGLPHDWLREFREDGIVPEIVYPGLNYGSQSHNHNELNSFISAVASVPVRNNIESPQYDQIVNSILEIYLGITPDTFNYKGVDYTPRSFAKSLGIDPDNYVEISSYSHFPFYSRAVLEVPDNWAMEKIYNVPLDELIGIMDFSLANGYTIAWDGDVSEWGFSHSKGIAIMPEISESAEFPGELKAGAEKRSTQELREEAMKLNKIFPEVKVTQEMRQEGFENSSTTDDHGMHITGMVKDQNGMKYYKVKNSWGTDSNPLGGYLFMSEPYARAKTILILVNKNGIPPAIKTKLGL